MTTLQESPWATQEAFLPMHVPRQQEMVWDEDQRVGFIPCKLNLHNQSVSYNPYAQTQPRRDLSGQVRALQQHYVISGTDNSVGELLEIDPTLFALLMEAVGPLKRAFGDTLLRIRVQNADDDRLLKVAVQIPPDFTAAEMALQAFDQSWWLNNCHRSTGTLLFDYERRDAI